MTSSTNEYLHDLIDCECLQADYVTFENRTYLVGLDDSEGEIFDYCYGPRSAYVETQAVLDDVHEYLVTGETTDEVFGYCGEITEFLMDLQAVAKGDIEAVNHAIRQVTDVDGRRYCRSIEDLLEQLEESVVDVWEIHRSNCPF